MKKVLLLGLLTTGFSGYVFAAEGTGTSVVIKDVPASTPVAKQPVQVVKDSSKPAQKVAGNVVVTNKAKAAPSASVSSPTIQKTASVTTQDPNEEYYKNIASSDKGLTYDLLAQPLINEIEESVLLSVANYLKANLKIVDITVEPSPDVLKIIGTVNIYGQKARAIIRDEKVANKHIYSFTIEFPAALKLSSLAQELSVIDFTLNNPQLIFSTEEYIDLQLGGAKIVKGFNIVGDAVIDGALKPVNQLTNINTTRVFGSIKKGLIGTTISGLIPGEVPFGTGAKLTKMIMGIKIREFGEKLLSLKGDLAVVLNGQVAPLTFASILDFGDDKLQLSGLLNSVWQDPFGIKGITISDVGLSGTILYARGGTLDGIGIKGTIKLGDKLFKMTSKGSLTTGAVYIGELDGTLSFKDAMVLVNGITSAALPANDIFRVIPNPSLKNPKLHMVPVTTTVFGELYPASIKMSGNIELLGVNGTLSLVVDKAKGSSAFGEVLPIIAGPLRITGGGKDGGPIILVALGKKPEMKLSGRLQIDPFLNSQTDFFVKNNVVDFITSHKFKIASGAECSLEVKGASSVKNADFTLDVSFDNTFFSYLNNEIDTVLKSVGKELTGSLRDAAEKVDKGNKALNALDDQIFKVQLQIEDLYNKSMLNQGVKALQEGASQVKAASEAVNTEVAKFDEHIQSAQSGFDKAGRELEKIGKEIESAGKAVGNAFKDMFTGHDPVKEAERRKREAREKKKEEIERQQDLQKFYEAVKKIEQERKDKALAYQKTLQDIAKNLSTIQAAGGWLNLREQYLQQKMRELQVQIDADEQSRNLRERLNTKRGYEGTGGYHGALLDAERQVLYGLGTALNNELDRTIKKDLPAKALLKKVREKVQLGTTSNAQLEDLAKQFMVALDKVKSLKFDVDQHSKNMNEATLRAVGTRRRLFDLSDAEKAQFAARLHQGLYWGNNDLTSKLARINSHIQGEDEQEFDRLRSRYGRRAFGLFSNDRNKSREEEDYDVLNEIDVKRGAFENKKESENSYNVKIAAEEMGKVFFAQNQLDYADKALSAIVTALQKEFDKMSEKPGKKAVKSEKK